MQLAPFLMFEGQAGAAMAFYLEHIPDSSIENMMLYGPGEPGPEGTVKVALVKIAGTPVMMSDSFIKHGFTFTPSISLFITVDDKQSLEKIAASLSEEGKFLMPPGNYGFSQYFAWVQDKWGVSWQLNLP